MLDLIFEFLIKTKQKQTELDQIFSTSMSEIEKIISLCSLRNNDLECEQFKKFLKQHQLKQSPKSSKSISNLALSIEKLRSIIEDQRNFFNFKLNEVQNKNLFVETRINISLNLTLF